MDLLIFGLVASICCAVIANSQEQQDTVESDEYADSVNPSPNIASQPLYKDQEELPEGFQVIDGVVLDTTNIMIQDASGNRTDYIFYDSQSGQEGQRGVIYRRPRHEAGYHFIVFDDPEEPPGSGHLVLLQKMLGFTLAKNTSANSQEMRLYEAFHLDLTDELNEEHEQELQEIKNGGLDVGDQGDYESLQLNPEDLGGETGDTQNSENANPDPTLAPSDLPEDLGGDAQNSENNPGPDTTLAPSDLPADLQGGDTQNSENTPGPDTTLAPSGLDEGTPAITDDDGSFPSALPDFKNSESASEPTLTYETSGEGNNQEAPPIANEKGANQTTTETVTTTTEDPDHPAWVPPYKAISHTLEDAPSLSAHENVSSISKYSNDSQTLSAKTEANVEVEIGTPNKDDEIADGQVDGAPPNASILKIRRNASSEIRNGTYADIKTLLIPPVYDDDETGPTNQSNIEIVNGDSTTVAADQSVSIISTTTDMPVTHSMTFVPFLQNASEVERNMNTNNEPGQISEDLPTQPFSGNEEIISTTSKSVGVASEPDFVVAYITNQAPPTLVPTSSVTEDYTAAQEPESGTTQNSGGNIEMATREDSTPVPIPVVEDVPISRRKKRHDVNMHV